MQKMNQKTFQTIIFDLDGTLLNTIDDLADSMNHVLSLHGYPTHSVDTIKRFVGNGLPKLAKRALPADVSEEILNAVTKEFISYYTDHCQIKTKAYDGILNLLHHLTEKKISMAIVTNKDQTAASELGKTCFDGLIPVIIGAREGVAKKPAPDSVFEAIKELGANTETSVYVGDSEVDYATAVNAGLHAILVSWGFRDRSLLESLEPLLVIDRPEQILDVIE